MRRGWRDGAGRSKGIRQVADAGGAVGDGNVTPLIEMNIPLWQRIALGTLALSSCGVWLMLMFQLIGRREWPSLALGLFLVALQPVGIWLFSYLALRGKLPARFRRDRAIGDRP